MATSGTVGQTIFTTRQVIDHAMRRCKLAAQQITAEHLAIARDVLWLQLSTLNSRGIALWAVAAQLQGLVDSVAQVALSTGTLDVLDANLRTITRLTGTASASTGTAANAFDSSLSTTCTNSVAAGYIQLLLATAAALTTCGICPNVSGTWAFTIQTSDDGVTWTTRVTQAATAVVAGTWLWYDVPGVSSTTYMRIVGGATTTLDVRELVFGNAPSDIPLAPIDRNTYAALPNKSSTGRPTMYWLDRQRNIPQLTVWPTPSSAYVMTSLVALYTQRQIQDVGTLAQELEIPQRWYMAIVCELAKHLSLEIKEVDASLVPVLTAIADLEMTKAWDGESDRSPVRLLPNIRAYTA